MSGDNSKPVEQRPANTDLSERGGWLKDVTPSVDAVKPGGLPSAQVQQSNGAARGGQASSNSGGAQQSGSNDGGNE